MAEKKTKKENTGKAAKPEKEAKGKQGSKKESKKAEEVQEIKIKARLSDVYKKEYCIRRSRRRLDLTGLHPADKTAFCPTIHT